MRMKIIDKDIKGKGYKTISKQPDVPLTAFAHIQKCMTHRNSPTILDVAGREKKILNV